MRKPKPAAPRGPQPTPKSPPAGATKSAGHPPAPEEMTMPDSVTPTSSAHAAPAPASLWLPVVRVELADWGGTDSPVKHPLGRLGRAALSLATIAEQPAIRSRLEDLECASWSCATVGTLSRYGHAATELQTELRHAHAHHVSPALRAEVEGMTERFKAMLFHHFKKDAEMMKKAAELDPGKTIGGLASTLLGLFQLLAPHQAFLSHDLTYYAAEDFERAPKLVAELTQQQAAWKVSDDGKLRRALRSEIVRLFGHLHAALSLVSFGRDDAPVLPSLSGLTKLPRKKQGPEAEAKAKKRAEAKQAREAAKAAAKAARAAKRAEAKQAEAKTAGGAAKAEPVGPAAEVADHAGVESEPPTDPAIAVTAPTVPAGAGPGEATPMSPAPTAANG